MAQFTNQATLSYSGSTTNSNVVTGEIVQVLSAQKDSVVSEYTANDLLTYVISIVNSGATPYTGLTVSDDLGAYIYQGNTVVPLTHDDGIVSLYVNGVQQATPTVVSGPPLVIRGINIPAGGSAVLIYRASLNSYAPLDVGSVITNTATISGGGISTDIAVSETVVAANTAFLTISKSLYPISVVENGQLTYTFVIQNSGNAPAVLADSVAVTDIFDPILSNISVTLNGAPWSSPVNYTYNTATGAFATVPGQITVPAATYTQDTDGSWVITPGVVVLEITGTV